MRADDGEERPWARTDLPGCGKTIICRTRVVSECLASETVENYSSADGLGGGSMRYNQGKEKELYTRGWVHGID